MTNKKEEEKIDSSISEEDALDMMKAGVVYGHKKSRTHPSMKKFIAANRQEIEFLDPEAISLYLEKTANFMSELIKKELAILFVGTTAGARDSIKEMAKALNCPHVTTRWVGGTLTNLKVIRKRIDYYKELQQKRETGELEKYTKKERLNFDKDIEKMTWSFDGLVDLKDLPAAIFVVDPQIHGTAVKEAKKLKIPIIAVVDTDDNFKEVDYPIIANDHARKSIGWVMENIKNRLKIKAGKEEVNNGEVNK